MQKRTTIFRIVCLTMRVSWKEILTFRDIKKLIGLISLFVILLFVRPKDFLYRTELMTECVFSTLSNCQPVSLGDEILKHLKILQHWAYDLTFFTLSQQVNALKRCLTKCALDKRRRRVFRSPGYFFFSFHGLDCLLVQRWGQSVLFFIYGIMLPFCIFITICNLGALYSKEEYGNTTSHCVIVY